MNDVEELAHRMASLEARVAAAEAVLAIEELKARYGELVDSRFRKGAIVNGAALDEITEAIAALFSTAGSWDGGRGLGVAVGRPAIAAKLRESTLVYSRHLFVKPRITVHDDRAEARWDLICPCTRPDGSAWWMVGFEDDTYVRVEGKWLIETMRLTTLTMSPAGAGWDRIFA